MPDYQNMTATEAVRLAKDVSGLTAEEIANATGTETEPEISAATIRRYLGSGDIYEPSLSRIPRLCRAMRNDVLVRWIEAKLERQPHEVSPAQSRAEVLTAVARVSACLGDAQRRLAESESRGIDPACARDVRGLMGDVIEDCRVVMAMLQHVAQEGGIKDRVVLFSVKREEKRPWWRFWK